VDLLNSPDIKRLKTAIGAAELRQKVIAGNVANADTPYFKRSEVVFEELLAGATGGDKPRLALKRTDPRHFGTGGAGAGGLQPRIVTDEASVMNNNNNNVDIDREMSLMAKNQLVYNTYIQQMNHDFRMLRIGIEGRI